MALSEAPSLRRALTLPLLVFYGLGVTIGAGIYVLIGAIAGHAGYASWASFLIAVIAMGFTAMSYCELTTRHPVSAGVAAFVDHGFRSPLFTRIVGLLVIAVTLISTSAIASGSVGYLREFVDLPPAVLLSAVAVAMAAIAAWGIVESMTFAAILSAIEIAGLLVIIAAGFGGIAQPLADMREIIGAVAPAHAWSGIFAASLLAVFAFIGFESLANVAEEAREPAQAMPQAILLTLGLSALLYMALAVAAMRVVAPSELAGSTAPLSLVFTKATGLDVRVLSAVAVLATLNGVIVQFIMVSRLMHGMARQGNLPSLFGDVNAKTRTPVKSTVIAAALVLAAALVIPFERLAEATSVTMLFVFALVNAALLAIKRRAPARSENVFEVSPAMPIAGLLSSLALLAAAFFL